MEGNDDDIRCSEKVKCVLFLKKKTHMFFTFCLKKDAGSEKDKIKTIMR